MTVDLHLHSRASDGDYGPVELAERCAAAGLASVALTDHNTMRNVPAARRAFAARGVELIPGVEISTRWRDGEHHLLALWAPLDDPPFAARIEAVRQSDLARSRRWVGNAVAAGMRMEWDALEERVGADRVPPFAVLSSMLIELNPADERLAPFREHRGGVWNALFAPGRELHTEPPDLPDLVEAIRWVRDAGAVPVLAHPARTFAASDGMEEILGTLRDAGLAGVEAWTPHHGHGVGARIHAIARSCGLAVSAGADYHGPTVKPFVRAPGAVTHNDDELLDELAAQRVPVTAAGAGG